jgi:hypothetical protein
MKSYKKSDKCELVYIPIAWNILDDEQRKDVEFISSFPNKSGKIKECIRQIRLMSRNNQNYQPQFIDIPSNTNELFDEATEDESLDLLI